MTNKQSIILEKWKLAGARFGGFQIDAEGNLICCVYDQAITIDKPTGILYRYQYDQDGKLITALPVLYNFDNN